MNSEEFLMLQMKNIHEIELKDKIPAKLYDSLIASIEGDDEGEEIDWSEYDSYPDDQDLKLSKRLEYVYAAMARLGDILEKEEIIELEQRMKLEPSNRIYPYLWAVAKKNDFENNEFFLSEVLDFHKTLFNQYGYLIELDDFFNATDTFMSPNLVSAFVENMNDFKPLFEDVVELHPEKLCLRHLLGRIYFFGEEYDKALTHYHYVKGVIDKKYKTLDEITEDSFYDFTYLAMMSDLAKIYRKQGQYDQALTYINHFFNSYGDWKFTGDDPLDMEFIRSEEMALIHHDKLEEYLLRMHANLELGNEEQFMHDYNNLKDERCFASELYKKEMAQGIALKSEYAVVFERIEEIEKQNSGHDE